MHKTSGLKKPLYIVAVSGGVDSMVLLHRLVHHDSARLVVAHIDHGIRSDSPKDAELVRTTAVRYGLPFELFEARLGGEGNDGSIISEEMARNIRWNFLRRIRDEYEADAIVTAHHSNDVVETMIINLSRGTGWRGIATLRETEEIRRPLIEWRKTDIIAYARQYAISWHEDRTNIQQVYLRNYIRHTVVPLISQAQFKELVQLHTRQCELRNELEQCVMVLPTTMKRYDYIMATDDIACELLRCRFGSFVRSELYRILLFVRTARPYKRLQLTSGLQLIVSVDRLIVVEDDN